MDVILVYFMGMLDLLTSNKRIVIVALVVLAIPSYFIYDYTQNNPRFCTTCHLMSSAYETWDASAMHDLNCHNCHETGIVESLDHVREVMFGSPESVTKITVIENEECESCHTSNDPNWLQVANTAGHEVHVFTAEEEPECIGCHGLQLHVFEPPEETCYECHSHDHDIACEVMDVHCTVCHEFTVTEYELIPERENCLRCHPSQKVMGVSFPSAAHNNTACMDCHNPHIEEQHAECTTCHTETASGLHTLPAHTDCIICHVPHTSEPMRDVCISCHVDKADHGGTAECRACHGF